MASTKLFLIVVAVVVINVSAMTISKPLWNTRAVRYPECFVSGHKMVRMGETYYDRCLKCLCDPYDGLVCDGPKCPTPYRSYQNDTCIKWSSDQCCCEEFGCKIGNKIYQIGQWYTDPSPQNQDHCWECLCEHDTDHIKCSKIICPIQVCVDATRREGECCSRCLRGPNCSYPPLPDVTIDMNAILLRPLLLGTSVYLQSSKDPMITYKCTCMIPGDDATCAREPFRWTS